MIGCAPDSFQQVRELPHRRRLSGPVDADNQRDLRSDLDGDRSIDGVENGADLLLHQIAEALAAARACFHGADDPIRRRDTNVRGDQQLLERIDRIDIDRSGSALGLIRATDDFVKPLDDLLLGAGETLADAAEDVHSFDITAFATKDTKDTTSAFSTKGLGVHGVLCGERFWKSMGSARV
jgi:hypothetical protein